MKLISELYNDGEITSLAKSLFKEERAKQRLDGWFLSREIAFQKDAELNNLPRELKAAYELEAIAKELPLSVSDNAIFAGTQSDAFARTYALINPAFEVESFSGYCDPTAVYDDIIPNEEITAKRISRVKEQSQNTDYVKALNAVYDKASAYTGEVAFFIEQVTGHLIPDFRYALKNGVLKMIEELEQKEEAEDDEKKNANCKCKLDTRMNKNSSA